VTLRVVLRWLLALIYVGFGAFHLMAVDSFHPIMPPWVPAWREVVLFTGACEIAGGIGLLVPRLRQAAGIGLALYAVCVFPANLYHAFSGVTVPGLPSSWWYHAPRLAFQPVFVLWALYAGEAYPFRSTSAAQASRWMRRSSRKPRAR
jgi:uncharacterized membrane protein